MNDQQAVSTSSTACFFYPNVTAAGRRIIFLSLPQGIQMQRRSALRLFHAIKK